MSQDIKEEKMTAEAEAEAADTETAEAKTEETAEAAQEDAAEAAAGESAEKESSKKDAKDEKIEELQDRLKRQMAEFDNFRKRTEKEKAAMYEIGARDIIEKILPVLDNFERGLAAMPEEEKGSSFAEGVAMIYKQFVKTLEDAGVEAIEAKGQTFDPNLHNAVMHIEDENLGENVIAQELQKGYKYRGTVVRHSMVQVAN
jgi:molecular chaperone GrpE